MKSKLIGAASAILCSVILAGCGSTIEAAKAEVRRQDEATINNAAKEELREMLKNGKFKKWYEGKNFVNNRNYGKNPIEGGPDFLKIYENKTADYKVGDMVMRMNWVEKNNVLVLTSNMTEREIRFNVGSDSLTDQFGTVWKAKN